MNKFDFSSFEVGTMFNKGVLSAAPTPIADAVTIDYPSRLEAMALDPSKIAENNNLVYEAGQIDVSVDLCKEIRVVRTGQKGEVTVGADTSRSSLVMHAALIMRQTLGIEEGLHIDVDDEVSLRHCGLGSSSSLIAGTAAAINELYGAPIKPLDMARFCAQNHGEEIDSDDTRLMPVQCIGGSAVCGHFKGGLVILSGQATPIFMQDISSELDVVIGVPEDFDHPDSQQLLNDEVDNIKGFANTGALFGPEIAYRLVHQVLPGLVGGDMKPCKDLIFDYRWDMGSIRNCSFVYPRMIDIGESLRHAKERDDIQLISLSSVGPGYFALTSNTPYVEELFHELGMDTYVTKAHNGAYSRRFES